MSAAGVSFVTSFFSGKSDYIDTIIILSIVIINSTIGILQETKAEKEAKTEIKTGKETETKTETKAETKKE